MTSTAAHAFRELPKEMAGHLASSLGAMLGQTVKVAAADGKVAADWVMSATLSGSLEGILVAALDKAAAASLTRAVLGMDGPPDDDAVADTLREVASQACGLLTQGRTGTGARVQVQVARGAAVPAGRPTTFALRAKGGISARVAWWSDVRAASEPAAAKPAGTASEPAAAPPVVEAVGPEPVPVPAAPEAAPNVEMILDIDLPLTVRFGTTEMPLSALTRLGPGSVIDLGRSPDDPVDVLVNGKVLARGEVVVVSGYYGVRITEILGAADRIRSLGA